MSRKTVESFTDDQGKKHSAPSLKAYEIREHKRHEAEKRNAAYRAQFPTLEDELEFCLAQGGRTKQVNKLRKKIKEQKNVQSNNDTTHNKPKNRKPRRSRKGRNQNV